MSVEDRIKELETRLSELEDDHIKLLLYGCHCKNKNLVCSSVMHYCICDKLDKKTHKCKSKIEVHKCVCQYEVKDGIEGKTIVRWCRAHPNHIFFDSKSEYSNPFLFMKHIINQLKK
jgi:hypothetical protein